MKLKVLFTLSVIAVFVLILHSSFKYASSGGLCDAPLLGAAHSGAPGEVNCTGCHSGTANSGTGSLLVNLGVPGDIYTPGQLYTATVALSQTNIDKFGFQVTILADSTNTSTGSLVITDAINTRLIPDVTREYVGNTPCGADADTIGETTWTFDWQAPATDKGTLTAYISALATNHSHSTSGDTTYTQTIQLTPEIPTGIKATSNEVIPISVYPNPFITSATIEFENKNEENYTLTIYNVTGALIRKIDNIKIGKINIKRENLKSGLYFFQLVNNSERVNTGKIVIE